MADSDLPTPPPRPPEAPREGLVSPIQVGKKQKKHKKKVSREPQRGRGFRGRR